MSEKDTLDTNYDELNPSIEEHQPVEESPAVEPVESKSKEEIAADNWRKMRERNQELERKHKEATARLAELEAASQKKQLDPDDIPSWRDVNEALTEIKIKSQYPDFDQVVNRDNLERLKEQDPDLAMMIYNNKDLYSQSSVAYRAIKKMGIYDEQSEKDRELIKNNRNKPRTLTSMNTQEGSSGPLSHANAFAQGLTPELQKQLLKEMSDARKKH